MARLVLGLSSKVVEDLRKPYMSLQVSQMLCSIWEAVHFSCQNSLHSGGMVMDLVWMCHLLELIWNTVMLLMPASHSATQLDRTL